ncbi:hypothetical protein PR003_g21452 [Phytophthora rubi]|uniref:phosphoribosylaminoimidazolesuccinocarboxamide synthase n=1 Tax=Phytophthora rubi TaxID=129364 RepID=A0A6A4DGN8_9STRA|nr:hypothetical protein PR002_g21337 [Phytophthora rubi]KAE8995453.1 hypothetical protein PR001_g20116 [Phytophthora rubi]KAE9305610.1 hypothetical protein PR003_g21452 [Phytophthora rubi]
MSAAVAEAKKRTHTCLSKIESGRALTATSLPALSQELPAIRATCNVREVYVFEDRVLLESRRQSAFDRALASAPFKICVLTITSVWWFNQTQHIVANHLLGVLHPSAMLCKKCTVFSEEFMVRGYITDSTSIPTTKMAADFCGHKLPDGFKQHKKLPENLVTPSTKDDELVSVGLGGGGQRAYYPGAVGLLREEDARRYILLYDLTGSTLI